MPPLKHILTHLVNALVTQCHPVKIILFGSQARGDADAKSDTDLLVVMQVVKDRYSALLFINKILRPFRLPLDILVVDEAEFQSRSAIPGTVYYWAKKEGLALYDSTK